MRLTYLTVMNAWGSEALIYYSETVDTTDCARLTSHAEEINRADCTASCANM